MKPNWPISMARTNPLPASMCHSLQLATTAQLAEVHTVVGRCPGTETVCIQNRQTGTDSEEFMHH